MVMRMGLRIDTLLIEPLRSKQLSEGLTERPSEPLVEHLEELGELLIGHDRVMVDDGGKTRDHEG